MQAAQSLLPGASEGGDELLEVLNAAKACRYAVWKYNLRPTLMAVNFDDQFSVRGWLRHLGFVSEDKVAPSDLCENERGAADHQSERDFRRVSG